MRHAEDASLSESGPPRAHRPWSRWRLQSSGASGAVRGKAAGKAEENRTEEDPEKGREPSKGTPRNKSLNKKSGHESVQKPCDYCIVHAEIVCQLSAKQETMTQTDKKKYTKQKCTKTQKYKQKNQSCSRISNPAPIALKIEHPGQGRLCPQEGSKGRLDAPGGPTPFPRALLGLVMSVHWVPVGKRLLEGRNPVEASEQSLQTARLAAPSLTFWDSDPIHVLLQGKKLLSPYYCKLWCAKRKH